MRAVGEAPSHGWAGGGSSQEEVLGPSCSLRPQGEGAGLQQLCCVRTGVLAPARLARLRQLLGLLVPAGNKTGGSLHKHIQAGEGRDLQPYRFGGFLSSK